MQLVNMIKYLLAFFLVLSQAQNSIYTRYFHDISTGARCLDGTLSAFFVNPGAQKDKFMILFLGGGFCQGTTQGATLENCYLRSQTQFGSSKFAPASMNLDQNGILSSLQEVNPNFWNWTKVVVPYCDGSLHQGTKASPSKYLGRDLFFRGMNNTLAHFKFLDDKHDFFNATTIVITGESAGGLATFLWSNYVYDRSTKKNVYSIPDSGLFLLEYPNPATNKSVLVDQLKSLFSIVNNETGMPMQQCTAAGYENFQCLNVSNNVALYKTHIFLIQSSYDEFSVSVTLAKKCMKQSTNGAFSLDNCSYTDMEDINKYRLEALKAINNFTQQKDDFGTWTPACCQHGFEHVNAVFNGPTYKVPETTGVTISEALGMFLQNPKNKTNNIHIDTVLWPNNKPCSAHKAGLQSGMFGLRGLASQLTM